MLLQVVNPFTKYPLLQIMQILYANCCTSTHTRTGTRTHNTAVNRLISVKYQKETQVQLHHKHKEKGKEREQNYACLSLIRITFALTLSPVAMSLEELVPSDKSHIYSIFIRTGLVLSTLVVALCIPFFGTPPLNILHLSFPVHHSHLIAIVLVH